jgi:hypothetical protein
MIYTTNAVESLHMTMRKIIKTCGSFPSEEAALKLLYLALRKVSAKWEAIQHWKQALNQFEILWGDGIQAATGRGCSRCIFGEPQVSDGPPATTAAARRLPGHDDPVRAFDLTGQPRTRLITGALIHAAASGYPDAETGWFSMDYIVIEK